MLFTDKSEQARELWGLGDWQALLSVANDDSQNSDLTLYAIAALYQLGKLEEAKAKIGEIDPTPQQKSLMIKLLISGTYNSIGKAYACSNNYKQAEWFCKNALSHISNTTVSSALLNGRTSEQFSQLGIPRLADNISPALFKPDAESFFQASNKHFSHEPAQEIALAEFYQLNERYDNAIVHWQAVSALLNAETPQLYYDRLKGAYKSVKGFPQGTTEQEVLSGDVDKHQLLGEIHKRLQPEFYFEIGVQTGKSLSLAKCEAIGIDPMPMLSAELPPTARVITSSSDSFFMKQSDLLLKKSIDLCFIDGMHLFEYALRDFINVEKYAQPHSLIVIDDIFPCHPSQAQRERCTRAWTGDVWKLKVALEQYRPDLFILAIDAYPTGLLLISALNPNDSSLQENYQLILDQYSNIDHPPTDIINRNNSVSGKLVPTNEIADFLKLSKEKKYSSNEIKDNLSKYTYANISR